MMKNRSFFRVTFSLQIIFLFIFFLSLPSFAQSRGITVKTKTSSGDIKEIPLYSGYHALVIGVSDYDLWPDLPNAAKEAVDVAGMLEKMGFMVKTVLNPSSDELTKALNDLTYIVGRDADQAILLYYAGHGETEALADGTKLGYIIPRDCPLLKVDPQVFINKAVSMKDIEAYSLRIRSKHVLMLFDSCFSGSLFSLVRAVPEDITEKSMLPVRQFITAGTEEESVPDRSMFKRCLILGLQGDADLTRDGYVTGTELGLYLSDKVVQSTQRAQHPQYGKIRTPELARGDFIFQLPSSARIVTVPAKNENIELSAERERLEEERIQNLALGKRPDVSPGAGSKITNDLGMEFVYIPPGTFMMGSPSSESGRDDDEKQHQVTLTKGFYLQSTEVTQGQYKAVMGGNPSHFINCGDSCPVENVSWYDVQDFIQKLNRQEGRESYRLPTEAEWEYAARAGSTTAFASGDISKTDCEYDANLDAMGWYCGNSNNKTNPVAQKRPNAWGLFDMHGNVFEWCQDWYGGYPTKSVTDPTGPEDHSKRVRRGGCWRYSSKSCRSAYRYWDFPSYWNDTLGFRLLRIPVW